MHTSSLPCYLGVDWLRFEPATFWVASERFTVKLKFQGSSFPRSILVTSSRGCPQQFVRVVLVDFGERHDTRTNRQHYTAAVRRPTNQVSAWQAGRGSRPTRPTRTTCCGRPGEDVRNKSCMSGVSAKMLRGCYEEVVEFSLYAT